MACIGPNTRVCATRWLGVVVAILVVALTACSIPIPGTPSAVPGPLRPQDIPIDNVDPCALLTPAQRAQLQLDRPPQPAKEPSLLYPGEVSACSTRGTESPNLIYLQVVTTAGIEIFTSGRSAYEVRHIEVAGFPAAVAKSSYLDGSCKVLVDVAPGQMLDVQAFARSQDPQIPPDQVCRDAEQAASMAMDTLLNPPAPSSEPPADTPDTVDQPAPSNTPSAADVGAPFDPCRTLTWADFPEQVRRNPDDPGGQPKLMEVKPDSGYATGCRFDNSLAEIEICRGCDTPRETGHLAVLHDSRGLGRWGVGAAAQPARTRNQADHYRWPAGSSHLRPDRQRRSEVLGQGSPPAWRGGGVRRRRPLRHRPLRHRPAGRHRDRRAVHLTPRPYDHRNVQPDQHIAAHFDHGRAWPPMTAPNGNPTFAQPPSGDPNQASEQLLARMREQLATRHRPHVAGTGGHPAATVRPQLPPAPFQSIPTGPPPGGPGPQTLYAQNPYTQVGPPTCGHPGYGYGGGHPPRPAHGYPPAPAGYRQQPKRKRSKTGIAIILAVAMVLAVTVGYFGFRALTNGEGGETFTPPHGTYSVVIPDGMVQAPKLPLPAAITAESDLHLELVGKVGDGGAIGVSVVSGEFAEQTYEQIGSWYFQMMKDGYEGNPEKWGTAAKIDGGRTKVGGRDAFEINGRYSSPWIVPDDPPDVAVRFFRVFLVDAPSGPPVLIDCDWNTPGGTDAIEDRCTDVAASLRFTP